MINFRRFAFVSVLIVSCRLVAGEPTPATRAVIKPSLVTLAPGKEQRFKVLKLATRLKAASLVTEVRWSVNDIPGGNETVGRIDEGGIYRAPKTAPTPHEIHICAAAEGVANRYLFATVLMGSPEPSYKLLWSWGQLAGDGPLEKPHGITLDADGNILIADEGVSRVLRYTPRGEFLGEIGLGKGSEPGHFTSPRTVEIDAQGNIFVSDSKGDRPRMQVFTPEGKFLRIFAEKGTRPGMILRSHGLAFDEKQRLFSVDVDNMRINVYSHAGDFLYSFGKDGPSPGDFNAPHGLAVDRSGDVFVSGYYGPTKKFDAEGNFLFAFGHGDPPDGPVYFHSMTGDRWGNVYLAVRSKGGGQGKVQKDTGRRALSVAKYNNNGDYITGWSFKDPEHTETAAVVGDDGRVYALFAGKKELGVQVFAPQ